jgi:hypothetical protein
MEAERLLEINPLISKHAILAMLPNAHLAIDLRHQIAGVISKKGSEGVWRKD